MLSLKQEQKKQSQFIIRAVLLAALVAALLVVFNMQSTAVPTTAPKVSPALLEGLVGKSGESVQVLITTETQDYTAIVEAIEAAGGTVTHQYKYATGLAAELPGDSVLSIGELSGVVQVQNDSERNLESGSTSGNAMGGTLPLGADFETLDQAMRAGFAIPMNMDGIQLEGIDAAEAGVAPATYNTPAAMDVAPVWATGNFGQDSLAVVIDTGIYANHVMLAGNVIGGEDMSSDVGTAYEGFDLATNHWHGTHVSGILAGHAQLVLPNTDLLVQSLELHTGQPLPPFDAANKIVYLFGNAPATSLYGIKVFDHTGGSVSESVIIAAIERATDLKVVDGLDVDVINMSLGGGTGYDGRDLEDMTVDAATAAGITVVTSAGNDGPASMTVGSPGSANTSIAVGAIAHPVNVRVFNDINNGSLGIGNLLFTSDDPQMIYFSSRGPTADNRMKPATSGIGVYVFSSYNTAAAPQSLAWSSGTSMSSPSVAGVVSLLNTYGEMVGASPGDYKEAVVAGSNPIPYYDAYDQGAGLLSAADAMAALQADGDLGTVEAPLPAVGDQSAAKPKGSYIPTGALLAGHTIEVEDLAPGHAQHYWFKLRPKASKITIDVADVDTGAFNPFGINSFELYLDSPVRTSDCCYYINSANIYGDTSFVVEGGPGLPMMTGYARLVIENDWTSSDNASGKFTITLEENADRSRDEFHRGVLNTGDSEGFFPVGHGSEGVEIDLSWRRDWSMYSTSDLDMIVAWYDTDGNLFYDFNGASFGSPEKVRIEADNIDAVYVLIDGFDTYGKDEPWKLRVKYLGD